METCTLQIRAKLNLVLNIDGVYPDGYHRLDMLNASVNLADTVTLRPAARNAARMDGIPCTADNTIVRALNALSEQTGAHFDVAVVKRIPMCAGMGGSSADAAGVLLGANRLLGLPAAQLERIALDVGADCPYMLYGGYMRVRGRGEILNRIDGMPQLHVLVAQLCAGASTAAVYRAYDGQPSAARMEIETACAQIARGRAGYFNALQDAAIGLCPQIGVALQEMSARTPHAFMTGSGSAVVGVFDTLAAARQAGQSWRAGGKLYALSTCDCGAAFCATVEDGM